MPRELTAGERWVRRELARLRGERFSASAIAHFLSASLGRSREARQARPALARQSRRWMASGALAWAALALMRVEPWRRQLVPGLAWWALVSLMLDWHLGMLETPSGEPRPLARADALTLARAWLIPVVADTPSATAMGLGAVSDILDGHLARRSRATRAGRDLEGLVDACLTLAALRGARRRGMLSGWALGGEALRVAAGTLYVAVIYFGRARAPQAARLRAARVTTVLRSGGLIAAGAGQREAGNILLGVGSAASLALLAISATRPRPEPATIGGPCPAVRLGVPARVPPPEASHPQL